MTQPFRQAMAELHTWAGLVCGWLLYFVFLTGTLGFFDTEIDAWMRPEAPQRVAMSTDRAIALAEARIADQAPVSDQFIIYPPSGRDVAELTVFWRTAPDGTGAATSRTEVLDRTTGQPLMARATGGGEALYAMHYALHYLPTDTAYWIVGVCTMFMLVAIASGVIAHKRIFRDFFTFRPGKGQRSWLDAHNLLGVLALPFHLMMTYSGLIFFCFMYMPALIAASYGAGDAGREAFFAEAFRNDVAPRTGTAAPLASLAAMTREAEAIWGPRQVRSIDVRRAGDASARVILTRTHVTPSSNGDRLAFDGTTGERLPSAVEPRSGPRLVNDTMMSLHEGLFAGPALRWLYFLSGVIGTAMVGTGLVLWTAKRRKALAPAHVGLALVERLNAGTLTGLPIGIAAYFWANRLLPVGWAPRADFELHALFAAWAATLAYAALAPLNRVWRDGFATAGALLGLVPLLNAATTARHLGVSVPAGDWVLAGFDLTACAFGAAFLWAAWRLRHWSAADAGAPQPLADAAEAAEAEGAC